MADRTTQIKRLLTAVVVLSVGLVVWIFFQSRQEQGPLPPPLPPKANQSPLTLSRIHHTATKDGAVQWKLEAGSAEMAPDNGKMVLKAPVVDFFLKNGGRVTLKATEGILDTKKNDIAVQGNVKVVYDRYTLETEALTYRHQIRRLETHAPVRITGQAFSLSAAGMTYDLDTNQTTFSENVKGIIHGKPGS